MLYLNRAQHGYIRAPDLWRSASLDFAMFLQRGPTRWWLTAHNSDLEPDSPAAKPNTVRWYVKRNLLAE
jgi:hypothetical protein